MAPIGATANYAVTDVLPSSLPVGPIENDNAVILTSTTDGLTAHAGGGQALGVPITTVIMRFTTVATAGDSATLPPALVGMQITVFNMAAANSMNIFPAASDNSGAGGKINALAANAAYALAANHVATFYCTTAGQWYTSNVVLA